jgi:RNA methyltransferase, TrmH family
VVEGPKLLGVALDAGAAVESVYVDPASVTSGDGIDALLDRCLEAGCRVFELDPGVLARVADTVTPQPVLAVVGSVDIGLAELGARQPDLVAVCVDVRDPGNAGAVLRAAEAAGAGGVICCGNSVDLSNPKTVRASAGALFHVPVVAGGDPEEVLEEVGRWGLARLGTVARHGTDYAQLDLTRPVAIVLGNEANGLPDLGDRIDEAVSIPMAGRAESLNVGVAAAVLCFEAARQRRAEGDAT